jgi:N-methylhydantoinase A/oxoprolinase/acetone carboxylase beta subunit
VPARLIVEEYDATTVIPPRWAALLDAWGNISLQLG